ncbi:MAG: tetratricopeptide repeat protein [Burkholderiales bacterium]|nr:tetratricopeptide repeat protein [Burkholderiales bacterium]
MLVRRITFVLVLLLGLSCRLSSAQTDAFDDAQQLYKQGRHEQSLARLDDHLAQNPRDARARFLKGVILTEQNRSQEAIAVFTELTQDFPELPEPYNNLAVLYASQGDYRNAREALEMAVRTHPRYAKAYENLGDIHAALASEAYGKALQLDQGSKSAGSKLKIIREIVPSAAADSASSAKADASAAPSPATAPSVEEAQPSRPALAAVDDAAPVLETVDAWASAWARGNASAYLSFYAPGFRPPSGETRAAWEATRREQLARARNLSIGIASPTVVFADPEHASVTFRQNYASETFKRTTTKTLHLVKRAERWLIEREIVGAE